MTRICRVALTLSLLTGVAIVAASPAAGTSLPSEHGSTTAKIGPMIDPDG